MITGALKSQIDSIWDAFWSGGIANPIEVIEQITYLLFIKRLDELQGLQDNKAATVKGAVVIDVFPKRKDKKGRPFKDYRWSQLKNLAPKEMYAVVSDHVFPWLRTLGGDRSAYAKHMEGARFTIPTPGLLAKVVDLLDQVPMEKRDTKGDVYEYMLGKIASAGQNGQFRTPRHIIRLMVELTAPKPDDVICDPAAGTCGFLVAANEYLRERHPEALRDKKSRAHFHSTMFHGFDFDHTEAEHAKNNLPDVVARWQRRDKSERNRARTEHSFCVTKADIAAQGYDLSLNRYKEVTHAEVSHQSPKAILLSLASLESEISQGISELEGLLK